MMSMPLLWQTLLLMTIAYLVGAALACFLRRAFFPAREVAHAQSAPRTASPPVPAPVAVPIPVPVPRAATPAAVPPSTIVNPVPMPGSDRSAVAAAIAPAGEDPAVARTGEPFRRTDRDAPAPSPAPRPPAPEPNVRTLPPKPVPPSPPAGQARPDRFGDALSGPGEAGRASRDTFDSTAAAASAAAAAAAAGLAQVAAATISGGPSVPPEHPVVVVPAGSRPMPPDAALPDDLRRIRAIDPDLEARLNELGVTRFDQIAAWQATDVARFSQEFDFRGRIEHENWIEQAQILARGEETFYSRRRAKEEPASRPPVVVGSALPSPASTDDEVDDGIELATLQAARKASELAAAITPQEPSKLEASLSSGTSAAIAAAAASAAAAAAAAVSIPPHSRVEAPSTPPHVAERAAFATTAERVASVAPPASAASAAPLASTNRDQLQRIAGINAEIEKLLNVQGVARFNQIANWSRSDIDRFDRLLGHPGRVARENWIEQAQILSKGNETAYSRDFDRRRGGTGAAERPGPTLAEAPLTTLPAKLADAINDNSRSGSEADRTTAPRTGDLSTLRSVRSEAYRSGESATAGTAGSTSAGTAAAGGEAARVVRSAVPDDLKRIRGVGVLIEKKLNSMGTTRYDQIANWTTADIDRVSQALDFKGRIERENWVEQARILGSGGQTEFSRRVDRGEIETSRGRP